jgi:FkbM family methyltransferase
MDEVTVVADIGARYGLHPSWNAFDAKMRYIAFEPDEDEAERLRLNVKSTDTMQYEVLATALDRFDGARDFHLLKHRGLSSCLEPDLSSECFRHLKPGQAEIEKVIKIKVRRLDGVMDERGVVPDFLKVDTEGTEQDVVEGGEKLFERGILGVRASCNFQPCFVGQRLFSEQHDYLLARDFMLLNLDYRGYGFPRLGLFRKPDPMENEDFRYGILVHADGVWVRKLDSVDKLYSGDARTLARLKLAYFCMLNNAPDYGVDIARETRAKGSFPAAIKGSRLYRALQLHLARFLGRWRTVPDEQWEKAADLYRSIFDEELKGGSEFYPQVNAMVRALRETA